VENKNIIIFTILCVLCTCWYLGRELFKHLPTKTKTEQHKIIEIIPVNFYEIEKFFDANPDGSYICNDLIIIKAQWADAGYILQHRPSGKFFWSDSLSSGVWLPTQ